MKQEKPNPLPTAEYYQELTTQDLMTLVGLKSRQSIWRWVKQNKLPQPHYATPHAPRWYLGEILEFRQKQTKSFKEAPRGLKGQVETQNQNETKLNKILERFGLKQ